MALSTLPSLLLAPQERALLGRGLGHAGAVAWNSGKGPPTRLLLRPGWPGGPGVVGPHPRPWPPRVPKMWLPRPRASCVDLRAASCWPVRSGALGFQVLPVHTHSRSRLFQQHNRLALAPQKDQVALSGGALWGRVSEWGLCSPLPGAPGQTYSSPGQTAHP